MTRVLVAVLISLVAGFAVGAWVTTDAVDEAAAPSVAISEVSDPGAPLEERLLSLEQVIAEERAARLVLEEELEALNGAIDRIDAARSRVEAERERRMQEVRTRSNRSSAVDMAARMQEMQDRRVREFVDNGYSDDEARQLLRLESEVQYRSMELAWEAQRNGDTLDLISTMNTPQQLLREELGDDGFERYLDAQGQPTYIGVSQVMQGSPGSRAGIEPGDRIIRYNGERVFSVAELRNLTMQGSPGEDVIVEIDREGVRMQLSLQRGPIGISGSGASMRQMGWWGGG